MHKRFLSLISTRRALLAMLPVLALAASCGSKDPVTPNTPALILFADTTDGQVAQKQSESRFLAAVGSFDVINFDELPNATPVTGNEWVADGLSLINPDTSDAFRIVASGQAQSAPNVLGIVGTSAEPTQKVHLVLLPARRAVGFWIIDSESSEGDDRIRFYDSDNNLLVRITTPDSDVVVSDLSANYFVGLISDRAIARVEIGDTREVRIPEGISLDQVYLSR